MSESQLDCDTASAPELAAAVVHYIEEHGWKQRDLGFADGPVCLVGGLSAVCSGGPNVAGYDILRKPPKAVLSLAEALRAEGTIPVKIVTNEDDAYDPDEYGPEYVVPESVYDFNDRVASDVNDVLNPLRRVAGLPEVTDEEVKTNA